MECTGQPNPVQTVLDKAFDVLDFNMTVYPTDLYIKPC